MGDYTLVPVGPPITQAQVDTAVAAALADGYVLRGVVLESGGTVPGDLPTDAVVVRKDA